MSLNSHEGAPVISKLLDTMLRQLPSSQRKLGDQNLERAREVAVEFESVIDQNDRTIIEERITCALETKLGLDSKSGISKFRHAREYHRAARDAFKSAQRASDRGREEAHFSRLRRATSSKSASGHEVEDDPDTVMRVARPLYRSYLSCKNVFPTLSEREEWYAAVWSEACEKAGVSPRPLPQDVGFSDKGMKLLINTKMKIMHEVQSSYGFDTSRAPDSIGHNTRLAHTLLTNMTFIYRELNFGATPHHPYRHPIIQKAINMTWFQNKDGDGIVHHELFTPIPAQAIALALTVIECCINEWTDGTRKASNWNEGQYKTIYQSHISSLNELRDHDYPQGDNLLAQIQHDLLRDACIHAGVPGEPVTGLARLGHEALLAAIQDDLPAYPGNDNNIPTMPSGSSKPCSVLTHR